MTDFRLRDAALQDRDFLLAVYASTREEELTRVDWDADQKAGFVRMQFEAQDQYYRENYPGATFQVIEVTDRPAGRLYLHRRPDELRIMDIALLTEMRGHGIGTAVLSDILARAKNSGLPVTIHVERFNPALAWYASLGFRPVEDRGVYLFLKWEPA